MSQPPPEDQKPGSIGPPKLPLDYETPGPGRANTPRQVMLRMMLGFLLSATALVCGFLVLMVVSRFALLRDSFGGWGALILFLLPLATTFAITLFLSLRHRRYGYVTGVILGPFILVMTAGIMLLMICGGRPF